MKMSAQISTLLSKSLSTGAPAKAFYYQVLTSTDKPKATKNAYPYIPKNNGFTLIELLVTLLISAIIATFAIPAILTQLSTMEAKRVRYNLTHTLGEAKSESFVRRQDLLLCLADISGRCHKNSSDSLLLFIDNNDNNHFDSSTDVLVTKQILDPKYGTVHLRAGNRHYIKFWGNSGQPRGFFGHIKYCPTSVYNSAMYQVSFSQIGRIKYKPNAIHPTDCT